MDDALERFTFDVEERHWWYRGRRAVLDAVLDGLTLAPGSRILDAGCGSGRNMLELARRGSVTGVELASQSLELARARGVGPVLPGSLDEPLALDDGAFDLALALDVLEHVDGDEATLRELARIVAPGGHVLVTMPQYAWLWGEHDVLAHHHRRYTRGLLLHRAAEGGLRPARGA
jgi:SAM-dependent methyltransferase